MENIEPQNANKEVTPQEFAEKYQSLCDETGYRIVVNPTYIARDDGSWSTILQYSVGKLPKKEENGIKTNS